MIIFLSLTLGAAAFIYFPQNILSLISEKIRKTDIPLIEQQTYEFITGKMSSPDFLVYTNYTDENRSDDLPSGKDVLSESQGLFLLYFVNRGKEEEFDRCYQATLENLYLENGTFSWVKRKTAEKEQANALIDDLRLIRAQILAYEKWGGSKYKEEIKKISQALITYNTDKNIPVDFYNQSRAEKSSVITLSYLDIGTMKRLAEYDRQWNLILNNGQKIMQGGKIPQTGLYAESYNISKGEYKYPNEISLVQSVYVLLHLAEEGIADKEGTEWLWKQYERYGKIFSSYDSKTQEPSTDLESTALYALAAKLFYTVGDGNRAKAMLTRCEAFRVDKAGSQIYGGFGEESTKEVYSFDNLLYLLSSSIVYRQ